jgi:hypothetical protein
VNCNDIVLILLDHTATQTTNPNDVKLFKQVLRTGGGGQSRRVEESSEEERWKRTVAARTLAQSENGPTRQTETLDLPYRSVGAEGGTGARTKAILLLLFRERRGLFPGCNILAFRNPLSIRATFTGTHFVLGAGGRSWRTNPSICLSRPAQKDPRWSLLEDGVSRAQPKYKVS